MWCEGRNKSHHASYNIRMNRLLLLLEQNWTHHENSVNIAVSYRSSWLLFKYCFAINTHQRKTPLRIHCNSQNIGDSFLVSASHFHPQPWNAPLMAMISPICFCRYRCWKCWNNGRGGDDYQLMVLKKIEKSMASILSTKEEMKNMDYCGLWNSQHQVWILPLALLRHERRNGKEGRAIHHLSGVSLLHSCVRLCYLVRYVCKAQLHFNQLGINRQGFRNRLPCCLGSCRWHLPLPRYRANPNWNPWK